MDMGELVEGVLAMLLERRDSGWEGLERWFLSKGLPPVLLCVRCVVVVERVVCKEGTEEEWEITCVDDVVVVVVVAVVGISGTLVSSKAISLSWMSCVEWKLFRVFVVVPTVTPFCSSWTRSSSGVGRKRVEALEVGLVKVT